MCAADRRLRVAVVGGGWAGCAAAVELARSGCQVELFEAARSLGGRARAVEVDGRLLDNGQHILLGAYTETLRMLQLVGVQPRRALLRVPLQMRYPAGCGGMEFIAPRLPAPWHMALALLRAKGLAREDKLALARFTTSARWMGWQLNEDCSVAELLDRFDQTGTMVRLMWRPLCVAALNTPPERASAKVFLAVLRDSLGARRAASDMLVPRENLFALFPAAAAAYVRERGGAVHTGAQVGAIERGPGSWRLQPGGERFDAVVLATHAYQAARLLDSLPDCAALAGRLAALEYEPIATCYLQYAPGTTLDQPFYALADDPAAGRFGQFVFDRGQLDSGHAGMLAVVVSAARDAAALSQQALATAIAGQLAQALARPELAAPDWSRVITEKRATFSCTPGLDRPANATSMAGLVLAGDFTAGEYPATLESAMRSASAAAAAILSDRTLSPEKRRLSHSDGPGSDGRVQ